MTVSIRPGRYIAMVMQRPDGRTRRGPWTPEEGPTNPIWWKTYLDERPVYLVRAILPERLPVAPDPETPNGQREG